MIQCKKCGKWFEPYNFNLSGLCSDCQFTSTVSANTITPHDKLLVGMKKQKILRGGDCRNDIGGICKNQTAGACYDANRIST